MFAMISRNATSFVNALVSFWISLSTDSVPMTCPKWISGTQMNDNGSLTPRLFVRFRKRRSFRTSTTISALPVFATSPVMPSPMW